MIIEFQAARGGWERWHDQAATEAEQRDYGRRWRWTALWEMVWDAWVDEELVAGTLTEFVDSLRRFWTPLQPRLSDNVRYDLALEIQWLRVLASGPKALTTWPHVVADTWSRLEAASPLLDGEPQTSATGMASRTAQLASSSPQPPPGRTMVRTGDAALDALLLRWRDALRAQGLSSSHSNSMRRAVIAVLAEHGNSVMNALDGTSDGWDVPTRHALKLFRAWYSADKTEAMV